VSISPLNSELRRHALAARGFMPEDEGDALYSAAVLAAQAVPHAPFVEVGSYCGRSTVWLGGAARESNTTLFAIDHHFGSEENQPGWEWHDTSLVDSRTGRMDTLPFFRSTILDAGLADSVVTMVGDSPTIARHWTTPLAFLFIDGGHGVEPATLDYQLWTRALRLVEHLQFTMCSRTLPMVVGHLTKTFIFLHSKVDCLKMSAQQVRCAYYVESKGRELLGVRCDAPLAA
jgi:MMP 1-O-methyltransferase